MANFTGKVMGKLRDDLKFFREKREGSKKDAWRYKGALYTVYSRDTLWDDEC